MARARFRVELQATQFRNRLRRQMTRRTAAVAQQVAREIQTNISTDAGVSGPSLPGEFPRRDTGDLWQGIHVRRGRKKNSHEVVSAAFYSGFLEERRPFIWRTLLGMVSVVRRTLARRL